MPKHYLSRACFAPLMILALLTACERSNKTLDHHESAAIHVTDFSGNEIRLPQPAQRIIGLAPHVIENIYSAGAGDLLVAGVNYADFPAAAKQLPIVGGYNKFNLEAISALQPDLIIAWQSGTPHHFFDQIKRLGIPLYLDEPATLEQIAKSLRDIGTLTGREVSAELTATDYLKKLHTLQTQHAQKRAVRVFYQVWDDPLYTINGKQIISDVISLCGGKNIFANETIKAPIVSLESLIERDPEVIMTGSKHQTSQQALARWQTWQNMTATRHDNLFVVNPDIVTRHTVRLLDGAKAVCSHLDTARERLLRPDKTRHTETP